MTQATVAAQSRISAGYYSSVENNKSPPPRKAILRRLLATLGFKEHEVVAIERQAAVERRMAPEDGQLCDEAQDLIADIRSFAGALSPRFLKGLQTKIREAAL
jgi:transcriptional regulator with XRE-family HTH domain